MRDPKVITTPAFSEEEIANLIAEVERQGGERNRQLGKNASEVDFVAGAATVLHALGLWGTVPPKWLTRSMSGRPVFDHAHERPFIDFDEAKRTLFDALDGCTWSNSRNEEDESFSDWKERLDDARKAVNEVFPA